MNGLTRRWKPRTETDDRARGVESLVDRILAARGLDDPDAVARFCSPDLHQLHDPGLLPGIDAAATRLADAIRNREPIVLYGDYDVDGITATTILHRMIRTIDADAAVDWYIPHRLEEGYGLNADAIRSLADGGARVIVSVDCGITAVESAAAARDAGVDLIITDHHNPLDDGTTPDAFAIVHPRLDDSDYPFGELCGAGVAFKLAWRLATHWCNSDRVTPAMQQCLMHLLPLAALGTIADVVPLIDENRVIAAFGLRLIKQTPVIGLRALIEASDLMDDTIDSERVGFVLGPRLNACGRMGHAAEAIRLMLTDDPDDAASIASHLARVNRERQDAQRRIFDVAAEMAEQKGMTGDDRRIIVLADESWHPGVVGIVCSRLTEKFGRPSILMQRDGDMLRGSARSIDGYSIHGGLLHCQDLLERFGGHDMAAGLAVHADHFDTFVERLTEHANAHLRPEDLIPVAHFDCAATIDELEIETVNRLATLGPFGRSNPKPALHVAGATITDPPRQMGGQGKHLALMVRQGDGGRGRRMRCVWWNAGHLAADLAPGMRLDLLVEPKVNSWNGRTNVECELRDVRIH